MTNIIFVKIKKKIENLKHIRLCVIGSGLKIVSAQQVLNIINLFFLFQNNCPHEICIKPSLIDDVIY